MKLSSDVIKNTFKDYKNKNSQLNSKNLLSKVGDKAEEGVKKLGSELKKAASLSISEQAKTLAKNAPTSLIADTALSLSKALVPHSESEEKEDIKVKEEADKKIKEKIENERKENLEKLSKAKKVDDSKVRRVNRPAIFFVKGMQLLSDDYGGMDNMAEAVKGARVYEWDQKEEIIHEIKKRPKDQKIILVGHSLGSDTVVEVAQELNQLENKFRNVDLLVTIDSVGQNNDIIGQNVRENFNFISEDSWWSDGPNIAKNLNTTNVINELRPEDHTDLDDSNHIQSIVINRIDSLLNR